MRPEDVDAALVEKAARALWESDTPAPELGWPHWDVAVERAGNGLWDLPQMVADTRDMARHALAAVLSVEEVWAGGPGALPLPPQVITHEGVFHKDGVTPLEITDEMMEAGGWKKRQRLVTEWVNA